LVGASFVDAARESDRGQRRHLVCLWLVRQGQRVCSREGRRWDAGHQRHSWRLGCCEGEAQEGGQAKRDYMVVMVFVVGSMGVLFLGRRWGPCGF